MSDLLMIPSALIRPPCRVLQTRSHLWLGRLDTVSQWFNVTCLLGYLTSLSGGSRWWSTKAQQTKNINMIIMVSYYIAHTQCSVRFTHITPGHWTYSFMYHFNSLSCRIALVVARVSETQNQLGEHLIDLNVFFRIGHDLRSWLGVDYDIVCRDIYTVYKKRPSCLVKKKCTIVQSIEILINFLSYSLSIRYFISFFLWINQTYVFYTLVYCKKNLKVDQNTSSPKSLVWNYNLNEPEMNCRSNGS